MTADGERLVHVLVNQLGRGQLAVESIPAAGGAPTRLLTWGSGTPGRGPVSVRPGGVRLALAWSSAGGG